MTWIAGVLIGLPISVFAAAYIAGSLIPREHTAVATVQLAAPIDEVYDVISDYDTLHHWAPDTTPLEQLADDSGHRVYRRSQGDAMVFTLLEERRPSRLVIQNNAEPPVYGGTWTWSLAPSQLGTEATLTEDGWVAPPLFRAIMTLARWHDHTIVAHTTALKRHMEGEAG
jgi:uncharacterized protein YndB with AHSA1/START domain